MSSYADFTIGDFRLLSTRDSVYSVVMTIFREQDKHIYKTRTDEEWGEESERNEYKYSAPISSIRQRLDVMGFSISNAKKDAEKCVSLKLT